MSRPDGYRATSPDHKFPGNSSERLRPQVGLPNDIFSGDVTVGMVAAWLALPAWGETVKPSLQAFAGLHQLLRPVIGALAQQPEPQRQVLEAALGLGIAQLQASGPVQL